MKKLILIPTFLLSTALYFSCGTKSDSPQPEKPWYFSFEANGVPYKYKYERTVGFTGSSSNMGAFQSTTTA